MGQRDRALYALNVVEDAFSEVPNGTGQSAGTDAFDKAEQEGTRLALTPVDPAEKITSAMPLDQRMVDFD